MLNSCSEKNFVSASSIMRKKTQKEIPSHDKAILQKADIRSAVASRIAGICTISDIEYRYFSRKWKRQGWKKPGQDEIDFVCKNVTVIFKSFERQKLAKRYIKIFRITIRESR